MIGRRRFTLSLTLSVRGHATVAGLLLFGVHQPPAPAPAREISVSLVEITLGVPNRGQERMKAPPPVKVSEPDDRSTRPIPNIAPSKERLRPSNSLHAAQHLYATDVLSRPDNIRARKALRTLEPDDKRIQLCNIEAMEQLRRTDKIPPNWLRPMPFRILRFTQRKSSPTVRRSKPGNAGSGCATDAWSRRRHKPRPNSLLRSATPFPNRNGASTSSPQAPE